MKVFIAVTHLLGTGHLARALTLARAFVAQGHEAVVVSGGMPAAHLDSTGVVLGQLPAVRSDGVDFSTLLDENGHIINALHMDQRRAALLSILTRMEPDVVITELFPFGRRILKEEFTALLNATQSQRIPPLIISSIRDILAPPSKPSKVDLAEELIATYYDAVLVHAEAELTPLELSWPVSTRLADKLQYTGFVAPAPADPHPEGLGKGEVIVSAGGGDVGGHIFAAALDAAQQSNRRWRLLLGGAEATQRAAKMQASAPQNVTVEPARPDFRQMLYHADAAVAMCGYNTALDVLQSAVPTVFVPFDAGDEVEQGIRAQALSHQPGMAVLRSAELTGARLIEAVEAVVNAPPRAPLQGLDGATQAVEITQQLWTSKRAS